MVLLLKLIGSWPQMSFWAEGCRAAEASPLIDGMHCLGQRDSNNKLCTFLRATFVFHATAQGLDAAVDFHAKALMLLHQLRIIAHTIIGINQTEK